MFYLKYRPRTVSDLDNSHVKEIIKKILSSYDIPHAFLFVGQKGTGKTSTARIIAKSVNCLQNKFSHSLTPEVKLEQNNSKTSGVRSIEPCNTCKNCLSIDVSTSLDVVELDAASNRGIEDVRTIIRDSNYFPMVCRYRVYIIDEAHMITSDAFNALLKTLEEPPSSVIFILATTILEKIPKTIASRCRLVNFAKAKKSDIISMLNKIIKFEKLEVDSKLLNLIASHSDHSFRDAAKILEELITQNKLTLEEGRQFLGLLREKFFETLERKNSKDTLAWIEEFSSSGGNFKYLIEQLLDELRLALLYQYKVNLEDKPTFNFETIDIVTLMKLFNQAYNDLKISPIDSLPLEIAVVEFYNYSRRHPEGAKRPRDPVK